MEYRNIGCGEFFGWDGFYLMKLDGNGAVVVNHPKWSGTILNFDSDDKVTPLSCKMTFIKREE